MAEYLHPQKDKNELDEMSSLALAYVGDAVFELLVRTWLADRGGLTNRSLHEAAVGYVSAGAQAEAGDFLLPRLTEQERAVWRRGRNTQVHGTPKNATLGQYARATALEALFGYLHLSGQQERLQELFCALTEGFYAV